MRETIASVKRELEDSRQNHQETKNELRRHARQLDKVGELLQDALEPKPFSLNVTEFKQRPPWNEADVMSMAAKVAERIRGQREQLSLERAWTQDILDRFAPHKPEPEKENGS